MATISDGGYLEWLLADAVGTGHTLDLEAKLYLYPVAPKQGECYPKLARSSSD